MRPLKLSELDIVSGGMDEIIVHGTYRPPGNSSPGWGGWGGGNISGDWDSGGDESGDDYYEYDVPDPIELAANTTLAALEDALQNAKNLGLDIVKIGDSVMKVDDLLKAMPAIGNVLDAVDVYNALQSGDTTEILNVVGDVAIGLGVGVLAATLGAPALVGLAAGTIIVTVVNAGDIYNTTMSLADQAGNAIQDYGNNVGSQVDDFVDEYVSQPGNFFNFWNTPGNIGRNGDNYQEP